MATKGGLLWLYRLPLLSQKRGFAICRLHTCTSNTLHRRHDDHTFEVYRHITFPSENSRPGTWPGKYMGRASPVWQLALTHAATICHVIQLTNKFNTVRLCSPTKCGLLCLYRLPLLMSQTTGFVICLLHVHFKCKLLSWMSKIIQANVMILAPCGCTLFECYLFGDGPDSPVARYRPL